GGDALGVAAEAAGAHAVDDVVAGGEGAACAFEHQDAQVRVGADLSGQRDELLHHRPGDGIQSLRAIQRDRANARAARKQDGWLVHSGPIYPSIVTGSSLRETSRLRVHSHVVTLWWQHGLIYQIYPRSFMDSNADGTGDLRGITSQLDYLRWLGVDAIWISPIFPSPMADFGYDVSNYTDIDPIFGNLADFDELLAEAHKRDIQVILDYVPNHTSDQHPWFLESRQSTHNPRRNWYIWGKPKSDGSPPNNWLSSFGGPGWDLDTLTGEYYYHAYLKEQPDLN